MTENQIEHGSYMYIEVGIVEKCFLHVLLVQLSVHLSPWTLTKVSIDSVRFTRQMSLLTHTAAPLDLFSIWNWHPALSTTE